MLWFRGLPALLEIGLLVYCLIDAAQSDPRTVRALPRWAWMLAVVLLPLVGGIGWLVAGRPRPTIDDGAVVAPDDDPDFLRTLGPADLEQDQILRRWEEDLSRREGEVRRAEEEAARRRDHDAPDDEPGGPPARG